MRHYVVVFLESGMFPGTWLTDHFVRREEREKVPELPLIAADDGLPFPAHSEVIARLKEWQNEEEPQPAWTIEECILGGVAALTVITFDWKEKAPRRIATYTLQGVLSR